MTPPDSAEPNLSTTDVMSPERAGLVPPAPELAALGTAAERATAAAIAAADAEAAERRALDRRVAAVVEGMSDAFLAIGPDWRVRWANREAARLAGVGIDTLIGADHWERWPETVGTAVECEYRRVARERAPAQFEHHYPQLGAWHDVRVYPADDGGIAVFYRDITPQKLVEAERARQARGLA